MRRGRILILLVLIVIVGLGLAYLAFSQTGGGQAPAAEAPGGGVITKQVYYASQNIAAGTVITQEMLGTFSLPQENVAEVMFEAGEEVNLVGQSARFNLDQGTLITSSMVGASAGSISGPTWAFQIPSSTVAVAIPANRFSTMAYGVDAGAHVNVNVCMTFVDIDPAFQTMLPNYTSTITDIFFPADATVAPTITISPSSLGTAGTQGRTELDPTFQKPIYVIPSESSQRPRLVCQIALQDVMVLHMGSFQFANVAAAPPADPNAPAAAPAPERPDLITLMVAPQDSVALNYFVYSGAVFQLTLRNPNDNSRVDAQSATLTSILTQYNISLPSKLPYAPTTRLDLLTYPILPNDLQTP